MNWVNGRAMVALVGIALSMQCAHRSGGDAGQTDMLLLLISQYLGEQAECGQPTSLIFYTQHAGKKCGYQQNTNMVYSRTGATFLTGTTFSGSPVLECRMPGGGSYKSATYNSWYLADTSTPGQGYAPQFLFEHQPIPSFNNQTDVTTFSSYSPGNILICFCYECDAGYHGHYQIITAN